MPKIEISLPYIMKCVGQTDRALNVGKAIFKTSHIITCVLDNQRNIIKLCLQTSTLKSLPLFLDFWQSTLRIRHACKSNQVSLATVQVAAILNRLYHKFS